MVILLVYFFFSNIVSYLKEFCCCWDYLGLSDLSWSDVSVGCICFLGIENVRYENVIVRVFILF